MVYRTTLAPLPLPPPGPAFNTAIASASALPIAFPSSLPSTGPGPLYPLPHQRIIAPLPNPYTPLPKRRRRHTFLQYFHRPHQQHLDFIMSAANATVNGVKVGRKSCPLISCAVADRLADDPNKVVTVTATDGKTGTERPISYTHCKVVGNGSFGVVFAAKMLCKSART